MVRSPYGHVQAWKREANGSLSSVREGSSMGMDQHLLCVPYLGDEHQLPSGKRLHHDICKITMLCRWVNQLNFDWAMASIANC